VARWRLVLRFAALGALLFGARRLVMPDDTGERAVAVVVPNGASDADVAAATDEAILVDLAVRAGLARSDAVVRERLLSTLAAAGEEAPASQAIEVAISLRLHETDAVARRRLADLARRSLLSDVPAGPVSAEEIDAELAAHPDRYRLPPRVRFEQLFFSNARGARRDDSLASARERLGRADLAAAQAVADPWPWGRASSLINADRLDALYGDGFGDAVLALEVGAWSSPIESAFGAHLVRVVEREPGRVMSPSEAAARAGESIRDRSRAERLSRRLSELRPQYRATLEVAP
jgi:hypothetical protein